MVITIQRGGKNMSIRNLFKKKETTKEVTVNDLYAVFEKETMKFLGVGGFTEVELKKLENKYVFSKI